MNGFGLNYFSGGGPAEKVPEGFEVKYTARGQPYLAPVAAPRAPGAPPPDPNAGGEEMPDSLKGKGAEGQKSAAELAEAAGKEHERRELPLNCSMIDMAREYGLGIFLYFDFVKFLGWSNMALFIICLSNIVGHWYADPLDGSSVPITSIWEYFYISSYGPETWLIWRWTIFLCVIANFLTGPAYLFHVKHYFVILSRVDTEDKFAGVEDTIDANKGVSVTKHTIRLTLSYVIFAAAMTFSIWLNVRLISLGQTLEGQSALSLANSTFIIIMNALWKKSCVWLTQFELHWTWSSFRAHNTLKFFAFKIINVASLFFIKAVVITESLSTDATRCTLTAIAVQFVTLLLMEYTVYNIIEIAIPWATAWWKSSGKIYDIPEDERPIFDVAEEYLELLYRQYIIWMGLVVFPPITLLAVVGTWGEYKADKYRLLRIAKRPHRLRGSMKRFLAWFLFVTSVVALFTIPYGTFWLSTDFDQNLGQIFTDIDQELAKNCRIFLGRRQ